MNAIILATLLLAYQGGPSYKGQPREPHPFAPSLPKLTEKEDKELADIVQRFIDQDTGKLKGDAAKGKFGIVRILLSRRGILEACFRPLTMNHPNAGVQSNQITRHREHDMCVADHLHSYQVSTVGLPSSCPLEPAHISR